MRKHAYLIMAHNEPTLLKTLLECLDDPRNDIFLHIDKRSSNIIPADLEDILENSSLTILPSEKIFWGGFSQVRCELRLLKAATPGKYMYYHFISGVDLPLKDQDYIHKFFNNHKGQEFVSAGLVNTWKVSSRFNYYHFEEINDKLPRSLIRSLRYSADFLQFILGISRNTNAYEEYYFGGSWFSITHDLATITIAEEENITATFKYGFFIDEIFLATVLMNSELKNNISPKSNLRLVDWNRGKPYVWRSENFKELMASDCLFARKFSTKIDTEIIDMLKDHLLAKKSYPRQVSEQG